MTAPGEGLPSGEASPEVHAVVNRFTQEIHQIYTRSESFIQHHSQVGQDSRVIDKEYGMFVVSSHGRVSPYDRAKRQAIDNVPPTAEQQKFGVPDGSKICIELQRVSTPTPAGSKTIDMNLAVGLMTPANDNNNEFMHTYFDLTTLGDELIDVLLVEEPLRMKTSDEDEDIIFGVWGIELKGAENQLDSTSEAMTRERALWLLARLATALSTCEFDQVSYSHLRYRMEQDGWRRGASDNEANRQSFQWLIANLPGMLVQHIEGLQ